MTALYAYDGASAFSLTAAKDHGAVLITGYIVGHPGGMDPIDRARVQRIHELGMGFLPNWERAADFFRTATLADCRNAGKEALAACRALGVPDDGTVGVPFSFDYQVPASGFPRAADQLAACGDGMGGHMQPLGYGQVDLINYWAAHGLPGPHWLMGSTWRSSSQFAGHEAGSPHVALVQSHDAAGNWLNSPVAGTDINTVTQPARVPAWWPPGSPYAQGDNPLSDLTPAQLEQIASAVWNWDHLAIGDDPKNPTWAPTSALAWVTNSIGSVRADVAKIAAVSAVVNDVDKRVAALQSAVAALQPVAQAATDVAAIASAVTDAVVSKLRDLVWGVK